MHFLILDQNFWLDAIFRYFDPFLKIWLKCTFSKILGLTHSVINPLEKKGFLTHKIYGLNAHFSWVKCKLHIIWIKNSYINHF